MPPSGLWLVADAHWPKAHPCCSAWDLTLLCIPYRVLTTLLSKTSPWSHKAQQSSSKSTHASSMAAQQPNIAQMTSLKRSEFSGTREDCLLGTGIWKRPQLLPFYRLGKLEGKKKKKINVPASAGGCNTVWWEWNTWISSTSEHKTGSYFSIQKEESNWAWPYVANIFIAQVPEPFPPTPTSLHYQSWSIPPTAQSVVHLCLCPFCLMPSIGWYTQWKLSFSHFSVTAAEQKNVQQPDWSSMPPNA